MAVKYPKIFNEVFFNQICRVVFAIFIALTALSVGISGGFKTAKPFLAPDKMVEAEQALKQADLSFYLLLLCWFCIMAYLFVLSWLAAHIEREQHSK